VISEVKNAISEMKTVISVNKRIEALENALGDNGRMYFVRCENGVYRVEDDAGPLEMNKTQFEQWRNSKNENDDFVLFIVERTKK
jgi:hypothetical protein